MSDTQKVSQFPLITRLETSATAGKRVALVTCYLHYDVSAPISQDLMNELALQVQMFIEGWTRR